MRLLAFLNLLDKDGKISITNTALYVILLKVLFSPFDWTAAVTLFVAIMNYMHRRSEVGKQTSVEETEEFNKANKELASRIEEISNTLSTISAKVGFK